MRPLLLCFTIVAGFELQSASAAQLSEDVPVPAPLAAIGRTLGLDPLSDRARYVSELTRLLYTPPEGKNPDIEAALRALARREGAASADERLRVPLPLPAAVWSRAVFRRQVPVGQLLAAVATDRRAALLAYGLTGLDDDTLGYLAGDPALLSRLYAESAPAFAAFGASLRIRSNRVVPPGGEDAVSLWESVVRQRVGDPERFVRALFTLDGGRVAYLYDLLTQIDEPSRAFALGTWIVDDARRLARFQALVSAVVSAYPEWQPIELPFSRPVSDLTILLLRLRVAPSGAPVPPASRVFWESVFSTDDPLAPIPELPPDAGDLVDAAWLAEATGSGDQFTRADRLDQITFAQRVFEGVGSAEWDLAIPTVRALRNYRMLVLTFERMGVTAPAVYAAAVGHVSRIPARDPTRSFWSLSQLQGGLALIARATMVGSLDRRLAEELAVSLCAVPLGPGGRYSGGIAAWLERQLLPRLPPGPTAEARIVAALSGTRESPAARLSWEGQAYRVDLASAESRRLELVRERQQSYPVDLALALHRVTEWLAADDLDADGIREAATELAVVADDFRDAITRPEPNVLPRGVQPPRRADERIDTFVKSLTSIAAGRDPSRAARVGAQLAEFVDLALGEALISLAYASALGDPDGTALLPRNVALRHDFGLTHSSGGMRSRLPWGLPRQEFQPGVPWHVTGSALGLDIALAPVSLRRANIDLLGEAPRLPSHEREVLSVSVVLMDARRLDDEDREQIVQAVVRGRQRVAGLSAGRESFASIADLLTMDGRRRRAIGWMLDNDPAGVPSMFTLVELMTLGGGAPGTDLDAWGMSALASWGCACTRLLSPHHWALLAGRPQVGLMVPAMPDLNLHVAMVLRELGVPSVLTPPVVAAVVQDFAHRVAPTDPNDWWALVRAARAVPREEIEDSVADATGTDGPLVPDVTGSNLGR